MRCAIATVMLFSLVLTGFAQDTIYIPDDYSTFYDAINAAAAGDTIVVRPGTYYERIDFIGKAITIKSEYGPEVTVIDRVQWGTVVYCHSGEGQDSVLEGFTLTNGSGRDNPQGYECGGGVYCENSSPTLLNNIIISNRTGNGGGIYCRGASPLVVGTIIEQNAAVGPYYSRGGGVYCDSSSSPTFRECIFEANTSATGGGLFFDENSDATIECCRIAFNSASEEGGGILCKQGSDPVITNAWIHDNTAEYGGGIAAVSGSGPTLLNSIIAGNDAETGGGIYWYAFVADAPITNTVVFANTAIDGGGIYFKGWTAICNSVFWNNEATGHGPEFYVNQYSNPTISYCDVEGGPGAIFVEPGGNPIWGAGNIDADPQFVDATGFDFHLTIDSPCREAGFNAEPTLPSEDFEGDPRIAGSTVDIGADEFHHHLYCEGDIVPGSPISIRVVGNPGKPVKLFRSSGIQDPPQSTPYGDLYLQLPFKEKWSLGNVPATGVLFWDVTLPSGLNPGAEFYLQALVGAVGGPTSKITNHMTLTVE